MTLQAIVHGLSLKNLTATWEVKDKDGNVIDEGTCVNPWQYLPENLGSFMNAGGPMAALCGTVAATDLVNVLVNAPTLLRQELHAWYSNTLLPTTEWEAYTDSAVRDLEVQTDAQAVSCHISRSKWDNAYIRWRAENDIPSDEKYDIQRCNRLHADMAKKCLQLLNAWKGGYAGAWAADANYAECYDCHATAAGLGPDSGWNPSATAELGWVRNGKEDCTICHNVDPYHTTKPLPGPGIRPGKK